jgi:hypothetical protein
VIATDGLATEVVRAANHKFHVFHVNHSEHSEYHELTHASAIFGSGATAGETIV